MVDQSKEAAPLSAEGVPIEVWQNILLRLDYRSIKVLQRVCKSWKELIETPAFEAALLKSRPPPVSQLTESAIKIHPILHSFNPIANTVQRIKVYKKTSDDGHKGFTVVDLAAAETEYATSPSSSTLYLGGFGYGGTIKNKKGKGVTVKQVCEKIIELFNTPSKHDAQGYSYSEWAEEFEIDYGKTCLQMLFSRNDTDFPRFEGWLEPVTVSAEGVVSLIAKPFSGMDGY